MANNKVIYGEEILIDLTSDTATKEDVLNGKTFHLANGIAAAGTCLYNCDTSSDTVTASDVASGKTFHLASGLQATGEFSARAKKKTASLSSAEMNLLFTGLVKEPSWFVAILDGASTKTSDPAPVFLFNGTSCFALYCYSTTSNDRVTCICSSHSDYTFTYSSGTLRLSINGSVFPKGSFILYYL